MHTSQRPLDHPNRIRNLILGVDALLHDDLRHVLEHLLLLHFALLVGDLDAARGKDLETDGTCVSGTKHAFQVLILSYDACELQGEVALGEGISGPGCGAGVVLRCDKP